MPDKLQESILQDIIDITQSTLMRPEPTLPSPAGMCSTMLGVDRDRRGGHYLENTGPTLPLPPIDAGGLYKRLLRWP